MKTSKRKQAISSASFCRICKIALNRLDNEHTTDSGKVEKRFQQCLAKAFNKNRSEALESEVNLSKIGGRSIDPARKSGRMDFVVDGRVGVEIKVLAAPKNPARRAESLAMWDLGQITMDAIRLKNSKNLESRFLVWLITGSELKIYNSASDLRRLIHNRLFVDFVNSSKSGWPLHKENDANSDYKKQYRLQKNVIRDLNLNMAYSKSSPISKAIVQFSKKYAVMVLQIDQFIGIRS